MLIAARNSDSAVLTAASVIDRVGNHEKASSLAEEALALAVQTSNLKHQIHCHELLANASKATGDLAAVRSHLVNAMNLAEGQRTRTQSPDYRIAVFGEHSPLYERLVELWVDDRDHPQDRRASECFLLSERSRSRAFLDELAGISAPPRQAHREQSSSVTNSPSGSLSDAEKLGVPAGNARFKSSAEVLDYAQVRELLLAWQG